ncbi:MAG: hypothetical protein LH478_08315 [Chitinophagaceae bacterium]|nr:hypothetical protein [Chitinophagaceae bacterium]
MSYQFWQRYNHPELCYHLDLMWQKPGYTHNNAVKACLVYKAEEHVYSSAADYVFGRQVGKVKVALFEPCTNDVQLNIKQLFVACPKPVV